METQIQTQAAPARRRSLNEDVRLKRAALRVVLPLHERVGTWQMRSAQLLALGERMRARGGSLAELREEVEELSGMVQQERQRLIEEMALLPPNVGGHGRIVDTQRALERICGTLSEARKLAGA